MNCSVILAGLCQLNSWKRLAASENLNVIFLQEIFVTFDIRESYKKSSKSILQVKMCSVKFTTMGGIIILLWNQSMQIVLQFAVSFAGLIPTTVTQNFRLPWGNTDSENNWYLQNKP